MSQIALTFFVGKVSAVGSASFVSVLTPNAKSGLKPVIRQLDYSLAKWAMRKYK